MSGVITATVVAVAAMTAAEIFTAVAITGAVVGAVGAVTGVKEMQYAGMALGAVGGIGALAVSAGMFAAEGAALAAGGLDAAGSAGMWVGDTFTTVSATGAAGSGLGGAYTAADAVAMATGFEAAGIVPSAAGTPLYQDVISMVTGGGVPLDAAAGVPMSTAEAVTSPAVLPGVANDGGLTATATDTGLINMPQAGSDLPANDLLLSMDGQSAPGPGGHDGGWTRAQDGMGTVTSTEPGTVSPAVAVPTEGATPGAVTGVPAGSAPAPATGPTPLNPATFPSTAGIDRVLDPTLGTPKPSAWDGIMKLIDKPGAAYLIGGGVQAVGSFLAGAMDPKNEALIRASQAQAQQNLAASNLYNEQARKLASEQAAIASGIPVANRNLPVTGAPVGLINTPPPRPRVTGVPA